MRILHTADLHIGQILYQYYDRYDEHTHFFSQLEDWIEEYKPDALIVSGDIFDVGSPAASTWKFFTRTFVRLHSKSPDMKIVIAAGNHDSPSRLQAHSDVWELASTRVVGTPPPPSPLSEENWEDRFIVRLPVGYIIVLPFMSGDRTEVIIHLQEYVGKENRDGLPVVMMAHLAATGCDLQGHDFEIGTLRTVDLPGLGCGYDYLALGHIHRPQTLGDSSDAPKNTKVLKSPVARYSGSALHVSADEAYPHSVSLVDIDSRGGYVSITPLKIDQLRHFKTIPDGGGAFGSEKEALAYLKKFLKKKETGVYIRFRFDAGVDLPADFNNKVYDLIEESGMDIRFNPKILWTGTRETVTTGNEESALPGLEIETLAQMKNPLDFIEMNISRFDGVDLNDMKAMFMTIEDELQIMDEEERSVARK